MLFEAMSDLAHSPAWELLCSCKRAQMRRTVTRGNEGLVRACSSRQLRFRWSSMSPEGMLLSSCLCACCTSLLIHAGRPTPDTLLHPPAASTWHTEGCHHEWHVRLRGEACPPEKAWW